ncbi:MAG TPA: hypothetical protein VFW65_14740 [Pseudonocardiaceae bacterium]|nr:hypothetical protein [Pseudonocardiaceae bacterium]
MADVTVPSGEAGSPGTLFCWPGARATAGVIGVDLVDVHLMLLLDPLMMAVTMPPNEAEWPAMARFLRELADSADLIADRIDPAGLMQPSWIDSPADGSEARGE